MFVIVGLLQLALFIGLTFNFPKQRDQILLLALILLWTLVYIIGTITGLCGSNETRASYFGCPNWTCNAVLR